MKYLRRIFLSIAMLALSGTALAEERGTKDEAVAMADAAFAHVKSVGPDQAFKDFNDKANTAWHKKDLYVFVIAPDGFIAAHGANEKLIGKKLFDLKDPNGKPFVQEMIATAKKGSGWVDYEWAHPQTKKIESKATFVRRLSNFDGLVAVGIYR